MGLALASGGAVLELASIGSIGHGASHRSHSCSPTTTKALPHKSITALNILIGIKHLK